MEVVPAGGRCRACGFDGPLPQFPLHVPGCGGFDVEVLRGEELLVDALEIEEEALIGMEGWAVATEPKAPAASRRSTSCGSRRG